MIAKLVVVQIYLGR